MKNKKKIKLLTERIEKLESIITTNNILLQNPDDENSYLRMCIRDNEFITEGIVKKKHLEVLPIVNQKLK